MRNSLFIFLVGLLISLSSCRNDFEFESSKGGLTFSKDTVYLDTVFTNIGSSTYRLKVYNKSDADISIPNIQLGKGVNSKYRMMIDGLTGEDGTDDGTIGDGKIFNDVELLAKDSMFIFIEVTSDVASANPTDFLYTDQINFIHGNGEIQKVELVTLIQDAYFIYPQRSGVDDDFIYETVNFGVNDDAENVIAVGSNLDHADPTNGDEYTWGNSKPYVVYGYAFVPDGETLTVNPGARVHFHANSGLVIGKNAVLKINGGLSTTEALENEVIFEGDRLEPEFSNVPGQWGAIINYSTSTENNINHLTIKNATIGILSQNLATITDTATPYLKIQNSQIYDCSNFGLLARKSNVEGTNLVINNAGQATLACTYGGTYNFTHCTFNNNWSSSNQVAVLVNNNLETDDTIYVKDLVAANFNNCIIYGGNQVEMILDNVQSDTVTTLFDYKFNHCLIRFNNINNQFTSNPLYQFTTDSIHYVNCSIATNSSTFNPKFEDESLNQLWLSEDLNLPNDSSFATLYPFDINNNDRTTSTDLGAYQFVP
ncbi:hypothetical protein [Flavobacterium sp.]|uniref:hypothetical protein n=1 Tax=Flavobacterium sp. TaxID=239 RepID=UPI00261C6F7B|nr:hypothetical protein [Flavobacterium sp.]